MGEQLVDSFPPFYMEVTVAGKLYGYFFFSEIRRINVENSMRSRLNENKSCHVTILIPPSFV